MPEEDGQSKSIARLYAQPRDLSLSLTLSRLSFARRQWCQPEGGIAEVTLGDSRGALDSLIAPLANTSHQIIDRRSSHSRLLFRGTDGSSSIQLTAPLPRGRGSTTGALWRYLAGHLLLVPPALSAPGAAN
jgi:hypothetical protein